MNLPTPRPRLVLTTWRSLAIVTLCYASSAWAGHVTFAFIESTRGVDDARDEQVSIAWAVTMAVAWLVSVIAIVWDRRRR